MGLHPLTPTGIDSQTLSLWEQVLNEEKQLTELDQRRQNMADGGESAKEISIEMAEKQRTIQKLQAQIRSVLEKVLERQRESGHAGTTPGWIPDQEREELLEDEVDTIRDSIERFLEDQKIIKAVEGSGHRTEPADALYADCCLLPYGDIQSLLKKLPEHPRSLVYIERYFLRNHRNLLLNEIRHAQEHIDNSENLAAKKRNAATLDAAIEFRDEWCHQNRAEELTLDPDNDRVVDDVLYEKTQIELWLHRKPSLLALAKSIGIRFATLALLDLEYVPKLLTRKSQPQARLSIEGMDETD